MVTVRVRITGFRISVMGLRLWVRVCVMVRLLRSEFVLLTSVRVGPRLRKIFMVAVKVRFEKRCP